MNNFTIYLSTGLYGSDKIILSEQYYLMEINKRNIHAIFNYADNPFQSLYESDKKSLSEKYYQM
jgi:hypothetical protein